MTGNRGAALITTLLVCMVMMTISLCLTHLIRGKIRLANEVKQGIAARIKAQNLAQKCLFQLSTHRFSGDGMTWREDGKNRHWPFTGKAISMSGGEIFIQDTAGILPLYPVPLGTLKRLLLKRGVDASRVHVFMDSLKDWTDTDDRKELNGAEAMAYAGRGVPYRPRNEALQSIAELELIHGVTPKIQEILRQELTPAVGGGRNPLTIPESLIPVLLDADEARASQLLTLRREGRLTSRTFYTLFPETTDARDVVFSPSRTVILQSKATAGGISYRWEITVSFEEGRHGPYRIQSQQMVQGGDA